MTTTVLRTVPCRSCGHRIGPDDPTCAYCGAASRPKRHSSSRATEAVVRAVGRCSRCGGRMRRDRGLIARVMGAIKRSSGRTRLACSSCGHRERLR